MPRRIHILPDPLADQIAAGEVVERPASVVKELAENALDAAATRVRIAIRNGGKTEVRVADDGCGMGREDAVLALDRHATSKISRPDDLEGVRTFGFRGEALPSIASVSRLRLETAEQGDVGTRVRVKGGEIRGVEDCARQTGTTVGVRRLFFNVPARAKFLNRAAAESRAVARAVTSLALANLSAAFKLTSNGRTLLELPQAPDLVSRVAALWSDDFAAGFVPIAHEEEGTSVAGLAERPDAAETGPRRVHIFLAGRPFRDPELLAAAERAYRTTVPEGTKPSLLLYLDVPPGAADVNVHPAKLEIRFRDRAAVERAIEHAVREALAGAESAATMDEKPPLPQLRRAERAPGAEREGTDEDLRQLAMFMAAPEPSGAEQGGAEADEPPAPTEATVEWGPELWQLHESYILAETRSGVLLIDQHSAHERVLFEELMDAFDGGGISSQRLLFPITLRLSADEYASVEQVESFLGAAGFEVEPFGGRTVIVRGAPSPHPWFDAERCLREMIAELTAGSALTRAANSQHERIAKTFACKGAIKAGQRLAPPEMRRLFERLFATELPHHDVHGRPTIVRLSLDELDRRFGRHG